MDIHPLAFSMRNCYIAKHLFLRPRNRNNQLPNGVAGKDVRQRKNCYNSAAAVAAALLTYNGDAKNVRIFCGYFSPLLHSQSMIIKPP